MKTAEIRLFIFASFISFNFFFYKIIGDRNKKKKHSPSIKVKWSFRKHETIVEVPFRAGGHCGLGRMVVGFITTCTISPYQHKFESSEKY